MCSQNVTWHSEKVPSASQGERPRETPDRSAPWSWTSGLQKSEKGNFYCLRHTVNYSLFGGASKYRCLITFEYQIYDKKFLLCTYLFIWNSDIPGHPVFSFAKSGSPCLCKYLERRRILGRMRNSSAWCVGGKQKHTWAGVSKGEDEKNERRAARKKMLVQFITVTCYLLFIPNSTFNRVCCTAICQVWQFSVGADPRGLRLIVWHGHDSSWDSQQSGNFFPPGAVYTFLYLFINFLIWSIADLQRWINFRCTAKRFLF